MQNHAAFRPSQEALETRRQQRTSKHRLESTPLSTGHSPSSSSKPCGTFTRPRAPPLAHRCRSRDHPYPSPSSPAPEDQASLEHELSRLERSADAALPASEQQQEPSESSNSALNRRIASALEYASTADERARRVEQRSSELAQRTQNLEQQLSTLQQANAELRTVIENLLECKELEQQPQQHQPPHAHSATPPHSSTNGANVIASANCNGNLGRSPSMENALMHNSDNEHDDREGFDGDCDDDELEDEELPMLASYRSQQSADDADASDGWEKPVPKQAWPRMKEGAGGAAHKRALSDTNNVSRSAQPLNAEPDYQISIPSVESNDASVQPAVIEQSEASE